MTHYCTYFDGHYLTRGLALHDSLMRHGGEFELIVLCMDEAAASGLHQRALPCVRLLPLAELVAQYPALAAARGNRTNLEFYFTCTAWFMQHLLPSIPAGELLTYLDADLYFFASPQAVYDEIGAASVAITPHRFPASLSHLKYYGRFNVGWVSFRHDPTGLACAADWADKCAAWCFNRLEPERYADQKYLDAWEERFPGTVSLQHPGVNAAPWNVKDCTFAAGPAGPTVNGRPLVFYHFHALVHLGRQLYDPGLHRYDAVMSVGLREQVYLPYLRQLVSYESPAPGDQPELLPPVRLDDPRCGLAVPHLLARIQASELDSAERLASIQRYEAKLKQAYADHAHNVDYLKQVQEDNVDYLKQVQEDNADCLKQVQEDSAERLATIQRYEAKLKQAYADHAHNVAYIERLHAEIAAHVKVAEEHGRIIAALSVQLNATEKSRPDES